MGFPFQVICRLRPHLPHEYSGDSAVSMDPSSNTTSITCPTKGMTHTFPFSAVYGEESTQAEVYEGEVADFVKQVWQGQNATVFAYGTSGSGKTHTVSGYDGEEGLIPRTVQVSRATHRDFRRDNGSCRFVARRISSGRRTRVVEARRNGSRCASASSNCGGISVGT
jgi:hypothetical protein